MKVYVVLIALLIITHPIGVYGKSNINIVVSIGSLKSIVEEVCGQYENLDVIVPEGSDPHSYSLTSNDYKKIENADLIILADSEVLGIEKNIKKAYPNKEYLDFEDYKKYGAAFHTIPNFGENFHGYWLYPTNALSIAKAVAEKMKQLDSENSMQYEENYKNFRQRVLNAWNFVNESLPQSSCIVTVPGASYMAEVMRMKVKGTLLKEPNSFVQGSELEKYGEMLKKGEIKYVVCPEELKGTSVNKFAEELVRENGGMVVYFSIFSGKISYDSLLYYNLAAVKNPQSFYSSSSYFWIIISSVFGIIAVAEFLIILVWRRRLME